jgi:7-cyano-7-deazaguanine synthase
MKGLLLSGGMDSTSIAWWKRPDVAITIDYGQKPAAAEKLASEAICKALGIQHETVQVDCSALGSGDMSDTPPASVSPASDWWPFRNQLLITLAGMASVRLGLRELMVGTLAIDEIHADGRRSFVEGISELMSRQEGGIIVTAPAIEMDAAELVTKSGVPKSILGWTHSCHTSNLACGQCRGCRKHYGTMKKLGYAPY